LRALGLNIMIEEFELERVELPHLHRRRPLEPDIRVRGRFLGFFSTTPEPDASSSRTPRPPRTSNNNQPEGVKTQRR
ncbi:hypothetical protein, partial [Agromyces bauzanensis]|uniref:hypothetical protein n=1 Tax=Agromyces bauzanensis TaxID=1308924 RepID=UPI001E311656